MRPPAGHSRNSHAEPVSVTSPMPRKKALGKQRAGSLRRDYSFWLVTLIVMVIPLGMLMRLNFVRHGGASPTREGWGATPGEIEIATMVLREGLECVLVIAAISAGLQRARRAYHRSIAAGVGLGIAATLLTWRIAARLLDDLGRRTSALAVQAGTGLLAIVVLLVVMNWFFHKLYWTGWISLHQQKKQSLLRATAGGERGWVICLGMAALGFTSLYREGFEVVLFLQSYRLRLGNEVVHRGVLWGTLAAGLVALLTFAAHCRLPYRRMLIATGLMLAMVLLVMVGEEAQEMQLAGWLPATRIPWLAAVIPSGMDFWFSVFPTRESLAAQALVGALVFGSYFAARYFSQRRCARAAD